MLLIPPAGASRMSLYCELPQIVDAEQVRLDLDCIPAELILWPPGLKVLDGSIGYVHCGRGRDFNTVRDGDWIVRRTEGLAVLSDSVFRKRYQDFIAEVV